MFNPVQNQDNKLAGSGISITDTSIVLQTFTQINGTLLTMADFGDIGFIVMEPGTSREENGSFSGVTQNANGTATLTGVIRGLKFVTPYDQDLALRQPHAGGTIVRLSNTAPFYNELSALDNDETILGTWTFTNPNYPRMDTATPAPTDDEQLVTKKYVDDIAIAGAPNASTTIRGIVQEATLSQTDAGTNTGSTTARLFSVPGNIARVIQRAGWSSANDASGTDAYVITLTPALASYEDNNVIYFEAGTTNTGAATLNVNGLGAKTIKKNNTFDLETGDITAGAKITVIYDLSSDTFQMQTQQSSMISTADLTSINNFIINNNFPSTETIASFTAFRDIDDGELVYSQGSNSVETTYVDGSALSNDTTVVVTGGSLDLSDSIKLDNNLFVLAYDHLSSSQAVYIATTFDAQTNTFTSGADVSAGATTNTPFLDVIDTTHFITGYDNSVSGVLVRVGTVTGTVITLGASVVADNAVTANGNLMKIVMFTPTTGAVAYNLSASQDIRIRYFSVAGTVVTMGAAILISPVPTGYGGILSFKKVDSNNAILYYFDNTGANNVEKFVMIHEAAGILTQGTVVSGTTLAAASAPLDGDIKVLSSTLALASARGVRTLTLNVGTLAITVNAATALNATTRASKIMIQGNSYFTVVNGYSVGGPNGATINSRTFNLSGTTITQIFDQTIFNNNNAAVTYVGIFEFSPARAIMYYFWINNTVDDEITIATLDYTTFNNVLVGFANETKLAGQTIEIMLRGVNDAVAGVTAGKEYFASYNGKVYENIAGINEDETLLTRVGVGVDTNKLSIQL